MNYWYQKSLLRLTEHPREEIIALLDFAARLKADRQAGREQNYIAHKKIALIFEKSSTRTRCAFESACFDQHAHCSYLGPGRTQLGDKESVADTARVLGRFYDAIEYRGFAQDTVETLAKYAGVPVYNGLTDDFHPTQMLADLLTMREHSDKELSDISFAYLGDARNNMGHSLLLTAALLGMDVRICAPEALQPHKAIVAQALALASLSQAKILISSNPDEALLGCDFIHTDIWLSMGEAASVWGERVHLLMPYRVDMATLSKSQNPTVKFMHCLPAYHDLNTPMGAQFYAEFGLEGIEVDNQVFNSEHSIVFEQAENRMHTIKALLVATLSENLQN